MKVSDLQLQSFGTMLSDACNRERVTVRLLCQELAMSSTTFESV